MQKWPSLRFYFSQNVQHWECFVLSSDYSRRAPLMPSDSGGQGWGWLGHYKYPVSVQGVSWRRTDDPVWTWRCHLSVIKSTLSHKHSIRSPTVSWIGASCNYSHPVPEETSRAGVWFSDNYWAEGVRTVWGWHATLRNESTGGAGGGGPGGCLMISCFSSGALPEQNWSDYQQHLVVICIITHPCENLPWLR